MLIAYRDASETTPIGRVPPDVDLRVADESGDWILLVFDDATSGWVRRSSVSLDPSSSWPPILRALPGLLRGPDPRVADHLQRGEWTYDGGPILSPQVSAVAKAQRGAATVLGFGPRDASITEWAATDLTFYVLTLVTGLRFPWQHVSLSMTRQRGALGARGALVTVSGVAQEVFMSGTPQEDRLATVGFWVGKSAANNIAALAVHYTALSGDAPNF